MEKFESMLQELVRTEKSYVQRIEVMYQRYAVPLRQMARDRDTSIIPLYESQRLFGNIGEILGANMAFLRDLEEYMAARTRGTEEVGSTRLGDIIYRNVSLGKTSSCAESDEEVDVVFFMLQRLFCQFREGQTYRAIHDAF